MKSALLLVITICGFMISVSSYPSYRTYGGCGHNEEVPDCEPCAVTCVDAATGKICNTMCKFTNQCFCEQGYYYDSNGFCVPQSSCYLEDMEYLSESVFIP